MPECANAVIEVRVIRLGDQPVAMSFTPLEETGKSRLTDTAYVQLYIGPLGLEQSRAFTGSFSHRHKPSKK